RLGQVIAERGPDHVVDGVRTNTGPCHASGGIEVVAGPAVLGDVGVSQTPLQATFGSIVDLMPEAKGAFDDMVDVAGAAGKATGGCWRRGLAYASSGWNGESFGTAARVVEQGIAVAYGDWIAGGIGKV